MTRPPQRTLWPWAVYVKPCWGVIGANWPCSGFGAVAQAASNTLASAGSNKRMFICQLQERGNGRMTQESVARCPGAWQRAWSWVVQLRLGR